LILYYKSLSIISLLILKLNYLKFKYTIMKKIYFFLFLLVAAIGVFAQPTISSVSPLGGYPASSVTITGTNFNTTPANNIVYFGATQATVTSASTTSLTATVPVGAIFAPLTVLNSGSGLNVSSLKPYLPYYNNAAYVSATTNFKPNFTKSAGSTPMYLAIGDMDGDGKTDIVTTDASANTVYVLRNVSSGGTMTSSSFSTAVGFTTGSSPGFVRLGDIDGDGKLDIVVSNGGASTISVFRNTSSSGSITSGSFAAKVDFTMAGTPANMAIADLDGDGKQDISVCNNGTTISVLRNTSSPGSITMATRADFTAGNSNIGLTAADLDGDGKIDLACANNFASGSSGITVLRNTTSGTISFASGVTFSGPWSQTDVITLDIDGDGKLDLAAVGHLGLSVWQNTATSGVINSGSFGTRVDYTSFGNARTIASGDFDGDGRPDLVGTYYLAEDTRVFRNLTTGSGSTITTSSFAPYIAFPNVNQTGLAVGDLDGDGKADIITGHNVISVLQNDPLQPITGTTVVCAGSTTALADATTGGTWSSSNPAVATVGSATGVVTGVTAGTVSITYAGTAGATFSGNRVITTVTVNANPVVSPITGNTTLSTAITTTLADVTASGVWTSAATGTATIGSATGMVTGVSAGTALISYTVTTSGCSTTVTTNVTVNTPQNGLSFDGTDDWVNTPVNCDDAVMPVVTWEAWVKPTNPGFTSWKMIMGIEDSGWDRFLATESGLFSMGTGDGPFQPVSPDWNQWQHVAVVYNGATLKFYKNGVLYTYGGAVNVAAQVSAITLRLGRSAAGQIYEGNIDEVRVWNVERTQSQIQTNMNCDVSQQAGLVAYYRFNQGTAGGSNIGLTCAYDYSGGANIGTLTSFALTGSTSNYVTGAVGSCNTATPIAPGSFSGNTPVCVGSSISLSNANTGGIWSSASSNITLNSTSGLVTGVTGGTTAAVDYTLNCSTSSVTVTISALPAVSGGSNVGICPGTNTTLTASGASTYTWVPALHYLLLPAPALQLRQRLRLLIQLPAQTRQAV
jgi:hypothetical protein